MNIYSSWGFAENPFQTTALPATEKGRKLLIGRDSELQMLERRLYNPPKIATLEGLNGVGKTSLVNVAAYRLFDAHVRDSTRPLLIPCNRAFQLRPDRPVDDFILEVVAVVAQTLISRAEELKALNLEVAPATALDRWINAPQLTAVQGGLSGGWATFSGGVNVGKTVENNTTSGFSSSGLRQYVFNWLSTIFPTPDVGGVICIIDNLELLQTSDEARAHLEALRDELLTVPGLRWVLCGALGIVLGVASSPRLEGILHRPVELAGLADQDISALLSSRRDVFAAIESPYLPFTDADFSKLYHILNRNLRSLLSFADDYCQYIADRTQPQTTVEKAAAFDHWLVTASTDALSSVQGQLRPRAWEVFTRAVELGGSFAPGDFEEFQANSLQALRPQVRDLESVGLLISTRDEGDRRRKTVQAVRVNDFETAAG